MTMINFESKLINVQNEIDKIKSGHCLLVKLVNYDELCAILGSAQIIIDELNKIVHKICSTNSHSIFSQTDHDKILLVLPKMHKDELSDLGFEIHSTTQLYVNKDLPSAYMNCRIASVSFPKDSTKALDMRTLLMRMVTNYDSTSYYSEYDTQHHNLDIVKDSNKKLNLLRKAILNKTRKFAYQPIVDRKSGNIPYYECLLRIPDDNNNLISVGPIIQYAESKGLINIVDHMVFEMAVEELANDPSISLSVNISNIGILDSHLLKTAENLLKKHQVSERLIVEITETALNEDYDTTKMFIDRLHAFGCKFALDDFGSGFTSFKQLQNLPIDIIKIDGSYVRSITTNHHNKYFIEALVRISEELGVKTVAEFVENGEIAKFLIDLKVDGMQGNFFSAAKINRN